MLLLRWWRGLACLLVLILVFVVANNAQELLLPVTCYAQTGSDLLSDGGARLCSSQGLCHAQWQVQLDWMLMKVTAFSFRLSDTGRCLDSYGAPLRVQAQCQTIAFSSEDASQNTLQLQVSAIYYGGTTAVLSWQYRGADVSCATLATDPMSLDAMLVSRQLSVSLAPINVLLTLVEAAPTPLSALQLDCPLVPLDCQCRVGCAYSREFWLANPKSVVWQRPAITNAPLMCGHSVADWVSDRGGTNSNFPPAVHDALQAWAVAKLNLANYGCAAPLAQDAEAHEAFLFIDERFSRETSAITDLCMNRPPADMLPTYTYELTLWSAGSLYDGANNTVSPCACVDFECAMQFGLNKDDLEPTSGVGGNHPQQSNVGANGVSSNGFSGLDKPQHWDSLKLTFFIVACALAVAFAACVLCMLAYCTYNMCRGVGPTGLYSSANRYVFSRIGGGINEHEDCATITPASASTSTSTSTTTTTGQPTHHYDVIGAQ